jgi:photosystem II stability/assembly factor-like uncharacterized protein
MRKILSATSIFMVALYVGAYLKRGNEFELTESKTEEFESRQNGPSEFIKYHQGIRTRSDETKPSYKANYQLTELNKAAQQASARQKSKSSNRIQSITNGVVSFTERGPGNVPGRTRGIIVDPDDATHKTWFLGSAGGGIWKTTDAGTSWQWLTPYIPNMATTCLAMAESNHNVIYAGSGEGYGLVDGINGMGIFKSIDRGVSWSVLANSSILENVNRIVVDPAHDDIVLAACNKGIYQSIDGGLNWNKVYSGVVQDLRATPGNFSILYGGENGIGVIKSIDGGATWSHSNSGMSVDGRVEIAVSPVKTDRIVASAQGSLSGGNSDLYLSDDGGASWYLVTMTLSSKSLDYLSSQGWYDNTITFSPYSKDVVYVGGIGAYQITLGSPAVGGSGSYSMNEINTPSFITLINFSASAYGGKLDVGSSANQDTVEVRFGSGLTQKAHRFFVPDGATSGVADASYTFKDYVDVPFQVWNKKTNQQLMVSFRDQDRNGAFNLIAQNTTATDATQQSREYLFINNVVYNNTTPDPSIAQAGGQVYNKMYFFWPTLTGGATWTPNALPTSKLQIIYSKLNKYSSTVKTVSDSYNDYDGINNTNFVHPDQHNIYPIKQSDASQTFQLLMANDGGIFLSKISTSPGTTQGDWTKVGNGYNTSQFYGADKKPGVQEYFGGMQDNQTWYTPSGTVASSSTHYVTSPNLGGDGFEVLWNSFDGKKMIGGSQYNNFSRSVDGGTSWSSGFTGLSLKNGIPDNSKFPFISKLANSKQAPDNIYTVGSEGVWRSTNFGGTWQLTPLSSGWGLTSFIDVEVSRANANIVWAGAGQYSSGNLFVSTNKGVSFNSVPNPVGIKLGNISRIATHPWEPNTAYALYSFANTAKILKTTDLGQTWIDISGFGAGTSSTNGFPDVAVYCLYVRPDNTDIIWAGTEIGIVESLDAGATWSLLNTFPNVSVWDMKGQDNEIVIATHGRGIWTATLANDQNGISNILAFGTTPQSNFKLVIDVPIPYDSVIIKVNSTKKLKFVPPDSGTYVLQISNVPTGIITLQTISYKGTIAVTSPNTDARNLSLKGYQKNFYDYLATTNNFFLNGFTLQEFGLSNSSLQTAHNYPANKTLSATLLVPIIVSSGTNTSFIYDDVAIIQTGSNGSVFGEKAFNDYVVAEATKDGLNWTPITNGYNASSHANWLATFSSRGFGDQSMSITENFDLKNKFNADDTLLIRFRLYSNSDNTVGWGWSIDNLYIQETPTAVEPTITNEITAYPNPSSGKFIINYSLSKESMVAMNIWDATGRSISTLSLGMQPAGKNQTDLNLETMPDGIYLVRLKSNTGDRAFKVIIRK